MKLFDLLHEFKYGRAELCFFETGLERKGELVRTLGHYQLTRRISHDKTITRRLSDRKAKALMEWLVYDEAESVWKVNAPALILLNFYGDLGLFNSNMGNF